MGVISRKIFPACGKMCVCCPALRSSSRQPVKRYKKLLAEIFPKSADALPSERKIVKLCEYAVKNPFRIPKIAKYLEERCYKELRAEHIQFFNVVIDVFDKLLCICKSQIAYFAVSLLNVVAELLDNSRKDAIKILGCQTLTRFIYSQVDGTYTHSIEKLVKKVCMLAHEKGEDHLKLCLKASSLQCLSAMVWFMAELSHVFLEFDEIVNATLDNYGRVTCNEDNIDRGETHHNWVDEVIRCDGRGGSVVGNNSCHIVLLPPEKKDPTSLTREETESPEVWAQICVQSMVELAKEISTMCRVLEPMFVYFDYGRHWLPQHGLAIKVLSNMSYLMETPGNQQLILASVIRHLDHKNAVHDPQLKTFIIQVATCLARQIRSARMLAELGFVSDLCRHLRKSLQATMESIGDEQLNLMNVSLQNSIEDCLVEIAKGIGDAQPLFDKMALTLENLPRGVVARATIGSSIILARMISSALISSQRQQVFPESLLIQLLQVMLHPDVDARVGAHKIFSILLFPSLDSPHHEMGSLPYGTIYQHSKWSSDTGPAFASISALLEKLRRGKEGGVKAEKLSSSVGDSREVESIGEDRRLGSVIKNSPNLLKLSSIIDKAAGSTSLAEVELFIVKLSEDQVIQLLSSIWIQANLPDNLPSNIEAIAQSFNLTLISLRLKKPNDNILVCIFQLSLSLLNSSLDQIDGVLSPACKRSVFVLSSGMLMFASKIFNIPGVIEIFKSLALHEVDPYLGINDDHQVCLKSDADLRDYGTVADNRWAMSILTELRNNIHGLDITIRDVLVESLASVTGVDVDDLAMQLSETFAPDEAFMLGSKSNLDHNRMFSHSKESQSFDGDFLCNSSVEDEVVSEVSVTDLSRFIPKAPSSPSVPHLMSIGQLLQSAHEVAGQVAGGSVSTSPLPFNSMTSQCEAFGTGSRQKLSNWLSHENNYRQWAETSFPETPYNTKSALEKIISVNGHSQAPGLQKDSCLAMRLPPASPFDNFLKAAGC